MKSIGLFSGSFNPIHLGHTTLASAILQQTSLDEIWFIVSPQNPLKQRTDLAPEQQRLEMVRLALLDNDNMQASDIEFNLPKPSFTVNTLRHLSALYPEHKFSLIIGSDNLQIFNQWYEYQYILDHYDLIVYPRTGDNIEALLNQYPQVQIVNAPLLPISSTMIRHSIANGTFEQDSTRQWLNPRVATYLQNNHLYTNQ